MILTGMARLGRDAALKRTPGGESVCTLALAYNHGLRDDSGKRPTQWIEASLWGKRAEALAPYLTKGSQHWFVLSDVHVRQFVTREAKPGAALAARVLDIELGPRTEAAPARNEYAEAKGRYHSNRPPVENCPQPDAPAFTDEDIAF